jgi:hypothetical protein
VAVLALGAFASVAPAGPVRSVGAMTFINVDTVAIADRRGGELHALHLPPAASAAPKPFKRQREATCDQTHQANLAFLTYGFCTIRLSDPCPAP